MIVGLVIVGLAPQEVARRLPIPKANLPSCAWFLCSPVKHRDELHQRLLCASERPERKNFKSFQAGELETDRKFDWGKSFASKAKIRRQRDFIYTDPCIRLGCSKIGSQKLVENRITPG